MIICIDFDGTLCEHRYPDIGNEVPGAFDWMKKFQAAGAKLILFTMRSDSERSGPTLTQAVEWCRARGIEFCGVNTNPEQKEWTDSPKAYGNVYIDDAAACCPLRPSARMDGRPMVDWRIVGPAVAIKLGIVDADDDPAPNRHD
jgi:hypothetical protein